MTGAGSVPCHVGFIPDGNRRWAAARARPIAEGYRAGAERGADVVGWCLDAGVRDVSFFALSAENVRRRDPAEIAAVLDALADFCDHVRRRRGVRVRLVGDAVSVLARWPCAPLTALLDGDDRTPSDRPAVYAAVNYGWEADVATIARGPRGDGPGVLASHHVPEFDLVIRSGGQRRLSGFLPLQAAHAELWFADPLWPELPRAELERALAWYATQERHRGE